MTIASNSPLAAVTFEWNGNRCMRVYLQDTSGWLREAMYDGNSWSKGNNGKPLVQAKNSSPLTATAWMDGSNNPQVNMCLSKPEKGTEDL